MVGIAVGVGVHVGAGVQVGTGVHVGTGAGTLVIVGNGVRVGVAVIMTISGTATGVSVDCATAVAVGCATAVAVGLSVGLAVGVSVARSTSCCPSSPLFISHTTKRMMATTIATAAKAVAMETTECSRTHMRHSGWVIDP